MEAIVLAGGEAGPELQALGIRRVPLLRVGGETVLSRICRCLIEGGGATAVHVLAPDDVPLPGLPQVARAPYSGDVIADMTRVVKGSTDRELLVSSGDMPLLTPEAVRTVVELARTASAEVVYPVCTREAMEAALPGGQRTYRKLGGTHYNGGNLFYLDREWLLRIEPTLQQLFAMRKDPMALARFFGLGFAMRVLAGSVSLTQVQDFLGKKVGAKLLAPVLDYPELCADLDKAADLDTFKEFLDPLP